MEGLWDKYNRIKEVFYRDFVYDSSYTKQASCIPLSSVKNGVLKYKVKVKRGANNWYLFDPYPASEQQGIIYKFQINDQRYVFMFSNRYDGMRDLINNADEDVDCITSATESSIYRNDSFYIFV
jgi:hypothetical protein